MNQQPEKITALYFGNLCNRSINMTRRYCDSVISGAEAYDDEASRACLLYTSRCV